MALPEYVVRSYGGGAVVAQLTNNMDAGDLAFTISPTTGWSDQNDDPLGTTGPFSVVIDRFTNSEEKVLCSAINLTTGVVTVYDSGGTSGRGYDGSFAQAHVPGGSSSGVQNCWTAEEAFEANKAVNYILGGGLGPVAAVPLPYGQVAQLSAQSIASGSSTLVTFAGATPTLAHGMTFTSSAFVVPAAGLYTATGSVAWSNSNTGTFTTSVLQNGTAVEPIDDFYGAPGAAGMQGVTTVKTSPQIICALNDTISLQTFQNIGGPASTTVAGTVLQVCQLSA